MSEQKTIGFIGLDAGSGGAYFSVIAKYVDKA
jgi:hypothetical protein